MEERLKIGDHYEYDFGDEEWSFPTKSVIMYIEGDVAVMKVISMCAECEDLTLEYDEVLEKFPDFSDPEHGSYSCYLFLNLETSRIISDLGMYYYEKEHQKSGNEECLSDSYKEETEIDNSEISSEPTPISDELPF